MIRFPGPGTAKGHVAAKGRDLHIVNYVPYSAGMWCFVSEIISEWEVGLPGVSGKYTFLIGNPTWETLYLLFPFFTEVWVISHYLANFFPFGFSLLSLSWAGLFFPSLAPSVFICFSCTFMQYRTFFPHMWFILPIHIVFETLFSTNYSDFCTYGGYCFCSLILLPEVHPEVRGLRPLWSGPK